MLCLSNDSDYVLYMYSACMRTTRPVRVAIAVRRTVAHTFGGRGASGADACATRTPETPIQKMPLADACALSHVSHRSCGRSLRAIARVRVQLDIRYVSIPSIPSSESHCISHD